MAGERLSKLGDAWLVAAVAVALVAHISAEHVVPAALVVGGVVICWGAARLFAGGEGRAGFVLIFGIVLLSLRFFSGAVILARTGDPADFFVNLPNAFGLLADALVAGVATIAVVGVRTAIDLVRQRP